MRQGLKFAQRVVAAALCLAALAAPQVVFGADSTASDSLSAAHNYQLGPLKLSFGPDSDGHFGATLKGDKSWPFATFSGLPPVDHPPAKDSIAWFSYGTVDFTLDSGWSAAQGASNNVTFALKPTGTFGATLVGASGFRARSELPPEVKKKCDQDDIDLKNAIDAGDSAAQIKATLQAQADGCDVYEDPYHDLAAISLYPSFEYRFGHFTQKGTQYQANQAIFGAGARVFFPWKLNALWASWPFVSVAYYHVKDQSGSNIPVPDGIKADFISGEAKADFFLPVSLGSHSRALEVSFDMTASKATTGSDGKWGFLKNVQLLANIGSAWKPAITYREGKDRGLSYDKQVILGVAAELF
jgi:hypothetical protein